MPSKKKEPAIDTNEGAMVTEDTGDDLAQALARGITSMLQNPDSDTPDDDIPAETGAKEDGADAGGEPAPDGDLPESAEEKKKPAKKLAAKKKVKAKKDEGDEPDPEAAASQDAAESIADDDAGLLDDDTAQTTFDVPVPMAPEAVDLSACDVVLAMPADAANMDVFADSVDMATVDDDAPAADAEADVPAATPKRKVPRRKSPKAEEPAPAAPPPRKRAPRKKNTDLNVLKIDAYSDVETPEDLDDLIWHEIHNAYRTRRILTGTLGGVEKAENGVARGVIEYKGFRIIVTLDEMNISLPDNASRHSEPPGLRKEKRLNTMIHAQVDFVVRGIDSKTRSVIASRKDAMMKKRQVFYINGGPDGMPRVHEGRVVQARVVAVFEKVIRVEVFGVECTIIARDLSWEWIGDARQHFSVGDNILVRVNRIRGETADTLSIEADARSVKSQDGSENLKKCRVQGKYAGTVTDVRRGTVLVRLSIGVNAIAHSCFDNRMPGKKDDVSFVVTHIEEEKGVAMGIITRIIRQNL